MNITRGKIHTAKKVLIYGPEGIGKSTLASRFPDPVFIDTEGSTKNLDVARFDAPSSWAMLLDEIRYVIDHPEVCKTLVIDTADWAEKMAIQSVLDEHNKSGIEDFGYGNGYRYVYEHFGKLLNLLSDVIARGINVVITAHATLKKFEQPDELGAYDRYTMKLIDSPKTSIAASVKEWADMVLFANYKTIIVTDSKTKKTKAQGGARVMYTTHHTCWDAKNRYGLPDEIPMDYEAIRGVIEDNPDSDKNSVQVEPKPEREPKKESEKPTAETVHPAPETTKGKGNPSEDKIEGKTLHILQPSIPEGIPKTLQDLMKENNVDENEIQRVVASKGYFPEDMPITEYPEDFINGVLVGAWPQVFDSIIKDREELMKDIPFD